MSLMAYAITCRNMAAEILQSINVTDDFDEKSKNIANLLCRAAGVFEHISQHELANWKVKPDVSLPEACDELFLALSDLCIAEAQEITVKKGLLKGMSSGALSKVAADIYQKYEHALQLLKGMNGNEVVLPQFLTYLQLNAGLWKAITFKLLAQESYNKGSYGMAVAYAQAALALFVDKREPLLELFLSLYQNEKELVKQMTIKFTSENDSIYFEKIPTEIAIPEAKCLMKAIPFQPPEPLLIQIEQKKGSDCSIQ